MFFTVLFSIVFLIQIHSIDGNNRAVICTIIYFMCKYGWNTHQSLLFLQLLKYFIYIFKLYRHDIKPCAYYIHQLEAFENVFFMIILQRVGLLRSTFTNKCIYGNDETLLLNTFNNILRTREPSLIRNQYGYKNTTKKTV